MSCFVIYCSQVQYHSLDFEWFMCYTVGKRVPLVERRWGFITSQVTLNSIKSIHSCPPSARYKREMRRDKCVCFLFLVCPL